MSCTTTYYKGGISEEQKLTGIDQVTFSNKSTVEYTVVKDWDDAGNNSGTRPEAIYVLLKRTTDLLEESTDPYNDSSITWKTVPYYGTEDEDNIITIAPADPVKDEWSFTWEGSSMLKYPDDGTNTPYTYYAFEVAGQNNPETITSLSGQLGSTYTVTATSSDAEPEIITNTLDTGTLKIKKEVEGLKASTEDYKVTVTLELGGKPLTGSYGYQIDDPNETRVSGTFGDDIDTYGVIKVTDEGTITVNLYQDETLVLKGLPLGTTYTVAEDKISYYVATYSDAEKAAEGTSGTVSKENKEANVTIHNIYRPTGSLPLTIRKDEDYHGSSNTEAREYNFRIYEIATASEAKPVATDSDASMIWNLADESNRPDQITIAITEEGKTTGSETYTINYDGYAAEGYHYYLIDEVIPEDTRRTYDTSKYVIEVLVTDGDDDHKEGEGVLGAVVTKAWKLTYDEAGNLARFDEVGKEDNSDTYVFTNSYYAAGSLPLVVYKQVWYNDNPYGQDNRGEDVKFVFKLMNGQGTVIDTKVMTVDQLAGAGTAEIPFDVLNYTQDDIGQVYIYTVMEQIEAENADGYLGYLENTELFTVKVTITDNDDNTLNANPVFYWMDTSIEAGQEETEETESIGEPYDDGIVFNNFYFPEGDAKLIVSKTLEGAELPSGRFAATLKPIDVDETGAVAESEEEPEDVTAWFNADGEASFTLHYNAEGVYWYEVSEFIPWADIPATASNADDGTYTYDTAVYYVKITVEDQHDGTLAATAVEVTKTSPTGEAVDVTAEDDGITFRSITFNNKYTGSKIDVPVSKLWNDYENRYATRPESITVTLYRDGEKTDQTLVLNDGNGWKDVFTDLDEYDYGNKIVYTVEESSIEGYSGVITGSTAEGYEITNTWTKAGPGISIVKTASEKEDGTSYKRGETINYTIVVTNIGNVVLTDVVVTDELTGNSGNNAWKVESLEPGESVTFTASYTVVSADVTAKNVHNEASVTAKDPEGGDVEDKDSADTPVKTTGGSSSHSGSGGGGSSSSSSGTSSTGSGGPGGSSSSSGSPSGDLVSLTPEEFGALAQTGEGRETEAWMFTSLISGLMLILVALLRRKKDEEE